MLGCRASRHARVLCSAPNSPVLDAGVVVEEHTLEGYHSVEGVDMLPGDRAEPLRQAEPWRPDCPAEIGQENTPYSWLTISSQAVSLNLHQLLTLCPTAQVNSS